MIRLNFEECTEGEMKWADITRLSLLIKVEKQKVTHMTSSPSPIMSLSEADRTAHLEEAQTKGRRPIQGD
ncbi:hypothetical protein NHJ13051_004050 [Beauveria bassiana]